MNDTVVIYDRVRENLGKYHKLEIANIANLSINETLGRTIITSVTTLLANKVVTDVMIVLPSVSLIDKLAIFAISSL